MSEHSSNVHNLDDYRQPKEPRFSNDDEVHLHMASEGLKPYADIAQYKREVAISYEMTETEKQAKAIEYAAVSLRNLTLVRMDMLGIAPDVELGKAA